MNREEMVKIVEGFTSKELEELIKVAKKKESENLEKKVREIISNLEREFAKLEEIGVQVELSDNGERAEGTDVEIYYKHDYENEKKYVFLEI